MAEKSAGERAACEEGFPQEPMSESDVDTEESEPSSDGEEDVAEPAIAREQRRQLIFEYQEEYGCRFIAFSGEIRSLSAIPFEEMLQRIKPNQDLHLLLATPGGDGEAAIRLLRQLQSRCHHLTIVVPHQAKSAGTLLALGAHEIIMGPTSDLGPVDPQMWLINYGRMPAKAIVAAFEHAEHTAKGDGQLAEFHARTLANRSAIDAQHARDFLSHTSVQLRQALAGQPGRDADSVESLADGLAPLLITEPQSHAATMSASELMSVGLPIVELDPKTEHWSRIWDLWMRYLEIPENQIYESAEISFRFHLDPGS